MHENVIPRLVFSEVLKESTGCGAIRNKQEACSSKNLSCCRIDIWGQIQVLTQKSESLPPEPADETRPKLKSQSRFDRDQPGLEALITVRPARINR